MTHGSRLRSLGRCGSMSPPRTAQVRLAIEQSGDKLIREDVFGDVQVELFEALKSLTYDKFVTSAYFGRVQELKMREKEVRWLTDGGLRVVHKRKRAAHTSA